ncbi:uncharacterized protein LOC144181112 isoform X1 [Stigmatopora nigra]
METPTKQFDGNDPTDWFHNRRGRRRKLERLASCRGEPPMTRARWNSTRHHSQSLLPIMQNAVSITMVPVFSGHFSAEMPMLESVAPVPPFIILSKQTQPSSSQLLATSPGQSRVGEPPDFQRGPMLSPLPPRHTRLPLLTASAAYDLNIAPPPLYMDDGASVDQGESVTLQTDASSLFDLSDKLDLLAPSNQNNTQLSSLLWTSYPNRPPQVAQQLETSTSEPPHMAFLNLSSYLHANPSDDISSSFLAVGPPGNSIGCPSGGDTCGQSHGGGQMIMQPNNSGGVGSYPLYPQPNVYTHPAVQQLPPNSPTGFTGAIRDHQVHWSPSSAGGSALPPSSTLLPSRFRVSPLLPSHPRVSTLLPSRLRVSTHLPCRLKVECRASLPASQPNPV